MGTRYAWVLLTGVIAIAGTAPAWESLLGEVPGDLEPTNGAGASHRLLLETVTLKDGLRFLEAEAARRRQVSLGYRHRAYLTIQQSAARLALDLSRLEAACLAGSFDEVRAGLDRISPACQHAANQAKRWTAESTALADALADAPRQARQESVEAPTRELGAFAAVVALRKEAEALATWAEENGRYCVGYRMRGWRTLASGATRIARALAEVERASSSARGEGLRALAADGRALADSAGGWFRMLPPDRAGEAGEIQRRCLRLATTADALAASSAP